MMTTPTPEQIADMDQAMKVMIDTYPVFWWGLFSNCVDEGFTREEALELVKTQITPSIHKMP